MEKLTLSKKEAAELLGISTSTLTQWIVTGRIRATRKNLNAPRSPYLFTKADCLAALAQGVTISTLTITSPQLEYEKIPAGNATASTPAHVKRVNEKLAALLKIRTKR
ncbi:excisionase family DNA-binding protein [Hafnia paralvei]